MPDNIQPMKMNRAGGYPDPGPGHHHVQEQDELHRPDEALRPYRSTTGHRVACPRTPSPNFGHLPVNPYFCNNCERLLVLKMYHLGMMILFFSSMPKASINMRVTRITNENIEQYRNHFPNGFRKAFSSSLIENKS